MIQTVLGNLRPEHQTRFRGFLDQPAEPVGELERELSLYVDLLDNMAKRIRGIDIALVRRIEAACRGLLGLPHLEGDASVLVNAGVRYFLRKEEDYDETTGVLNFDDDVLVLNAICQSLGLSELVIAPSGA